MARRRTRPEPGLGKVKLILVGVLFALIWTGLLARTAYIQLYKGAQYSELASRQTLATEFERGRRGRIVDRDGNLLATSVEVKSVYLHPYKVQDKAAAVQLLASTLDMPREAISRLLASKKNFVWVKRQIKDREAAALAQAPTPGIYLTSEYVRLYPQGKLAGQVLGFVNVDGVGLEGMEKLYDSRMAGGKAEFVVQRDNLGRRLYLDASGREMDIDGKDVVLTIDAHIQALAERVLEDTVTSNKAKSGIALVADVKTGDILALANMPFFNPNAVRSSGPAQRRLRAALDIYEPGSTMKPFLFAAALEQGTITPEQRIDCENGRFKVGGGWVHDHHAYQWLTAREVLRYSSNIGSAKIAQDLGAQNYYWYLTRLGFGQKPDIDLAALSSGTLHPVEKWREFDLAAAAFGHGMGVTAVQLAQAYMALASGGELRPLRLVLDPEHKTAPVPPRIFSTQTAESVLEMMTEVVELDGTARKARIPGVPMAGKTGTAQKPKDGRYSEDYLSSFVGLVPASDPELLLVVMVDEPGGDVNAGGKIAAPAVKEIALGSLAYYGRLPSPPLPEPLPGEGARAEAEGATISADDAASGPEGTAAHGTEGDKEQAEAQPPAPLATVPDVRGLPLRRALEVLSRNGVVPVLKGGGVRVSGQQPAPREPWPAPNDKGDPDVFVLWLS
jgi:cell division protein FtsI (penicillin-binding protein 3)